MSLLVNFFAGPGAGKSTMASQVFSELKWAGEGYGDRATVGVVWR